MSGAPCVTMSMCVRRPSTSSWRHAQRNLLEALMKEAFGEICSVEIREVVDGTPSMPLTSDKRVRRRTSLTPGSGGASIVSIQRVGAAATGAKATLATPLADAAMDKEWGDVDDLRRSLRARRAPRMPCALPKICFCHVASIGQAPRYHGGRLCRRSACGLMRLTPHRLPLRRGLEGRWAAATNQQRLARQVQQRRHGV